MITGIDDINLTLFACLWVLGIYDCDGAHDMADPWMSERNLGA